jgi:hypothetical protein
MNASRLQVPVVPIRLIGLDRVLPCGAAMSHPGPVQIRLRADGLCGGDSDAPANQVRAQVSAL